MATWNSRGLRGSALEEFINRTNEKYLECGLALIQKIPTPITPINIDKETRHITLAYFDQKSTVDYIGAVQGIPVCFDAKESAVDTFPLQNIHEHQVRFMEAMEQQNGIAFILLYYSHRHEAYYVPLSDIVFDAKECNTDTFPLQNIHEHQVIFMQNFEKQGGIAFFLLAFTHRDEFYYLRFAKLMEFWTRAKEGGRKSFRYEELEPDYFLPKDRGVLIPYLDAMQKDLSARD